MRKRNRKRTAVSLAAMMVLGMLGNTGITARAEDVEQEAVAPQSESADMIAVDISWGILAFTYKDGQWDPETCTYIGGGWEADPEGGASVSVTNNGTAAVQVEYQFTAAEQTVVKNLQGTFVDGNNQPIQILSIPVGGAAQKAELHLESDRPTESFDTTIGTINIVIRE